MTTDSKQCPQCGAPMPSNAPAGLCPRCVMAMNMATETEFTDEVGPHGTRVLKQPPTPDELRDKFPGLEILELLGRGGMGAVYKARQKELDRIVALKILPPGIGEDPAFAERFSREAKALAKLNHPNIVTLYEFGRADGLFFFLMEFVDGVNLRQLLDTGRVASREALAIVPQICDALQYAHDNGIVHRDIKPENILMDRRGRVKVADFGLAKLVGEQGRAGSPLPADATSFENGAHGVTRPNNALTDAGKIMGTPQYMAPEQKDKPLEVDHRADIYALGVVFYQMLTGELPGKSLEAPSKKVQIDVRLDEIVLRALEKKPELRFQSAEELKTRVETMGTTPSGNPVIPKKNRRTKALAWLFLIGAACAFANMAYALSASYSVDWAFVYMWGIGGIGLSLLGVRYTFAARSQKRFPEQGVPPVGSERTNTSNETTTPAKSWTDRHRGMPKVLWVAICILGISALSNLALLHLNGPVGLVEAVVKSAFILGLWYRVRAVYLLTMFAAFFAGAVGVKLPIPYSLLLVGLTLAVILPLMLSTSWFFPFSMERSRRRLWLGGTTLLALAGFCVMLAAPAPRNLILRGNGGGRAHAVINQYPTGNVASNERQSILGPVVERVLQDPDNGDGRSNKETLVLRTGELINVLNGALNEGGARLRALLASEGDFLAEYDDYVAKRWAFISVGLRLSDFATTQWDTATPAQIDQALENPTAVEHVERFGATLYLLPDGLVPMTFAFSAKDGSRGLLQINSFNDNPRSITIRYKLIQTKPGNPGNTSIELQNAQRAWKNAGTVFGPVIDRVVRDPKAQGPDSLIDLDTGRLITPPAPRLADWEWMQNSGADAIGDTSDSVRGLIGTGGTVVVPTSSDSWDSITPLELRKTMIPLASSAVESTAMSGLGELPATFLFKTRSQNIGILQITGFTEAPGVNIRYKLLQKANTAVAKRGEYKITLTNGITVEVVAVTRDPLNNGIWWKPDGTKLAKPPGNHVEFTPNNNADGKDIGKDDHAIFLQYSWNADTSLSKSEDDYGPGGEMLGYLQIQEGGSVNLALEEAKRLGRLISGGAAGPKPSREDIGTAKVLRFPGGTQEATAMFTTAAGPWEKVAVYDGMRTKVAVNGTQVLCTPVPVNPRHEGGPVLMVTHDIDLEKYALRMFAVLTNGKREQTHFYNSKVKSRETQSSVHLGGFERNPANVKEYVLERTPWVHGEIRGIALNPGKRSPAQQEAAHTQQTSSAIEASAKSSETKSYILPHRVQSGQKVLDTARDFALEHQWKIQRESGGTTNGLDTVTLEAIDLSGKKIFFTEAAQPDGTARLIISAEAGSEFSVERIGTALALRLKLADGFVTSPEILNTPATNRTTPVTTPAADTSKWKPQIEAMNSMDWRKALATANKVANLPAGEGLAIVRANWTSVTNAESRKQFLKAFTFENHPHLIPVLELGYLDPAPAVQEWGMSYLKGIALRDFSEDYAAGKAWLAQHRHMQLSDAMHESIKAAATRVGGSDPKMVEAQLSLIRFSGRFRDQPKAVAGSGMEEALEKVINGKDPKLTEAALQASGELPLSPSWYQRVVLPKIQPENTLKVRSTAATALHGREGEWAVQPLLTALTNLLSSTSSTDRLLFSQFAGTLGGIGSPKSIPTMIAVIEAHNDYDTVYGVGYFGLGKLTGVDYDASHDGAWWRQWWEKNKQRFPSDVQALPIPQLSPAKNNSKPRASRTDIDPPVTERFAGGDTNKFYFLIGNTNSAAAPKEGFKLLLVLPGGDGGRAFHPFVKNSFKNALPSGYLMAQLVAPQWDAQQAEQLVWPTEKNRYPAMQFSTEQFVSSVISEIGQAHQLDARQIYTWSWSSGGPAAYAISLQPKTQVTGSFIAMSVFKPEQLPALDAAKGHAYYILHSPEDFIPMRMAEQARDALKTNGAPTHLQTYEGGHGWHGDVFGNIRNGMRWLEEQSEKSSKK